MASHGNLSKFFQGCSIKNISNKITTQFIYPLPEDSVSCGKP